MTTVSPNSSKAEQALAMRRINLTCTSSGSISAIDFDFSKAACETLSKMLSTYAGTSVKMAGGNDNTIGNEGAGVSVRLDIEILSEFLARGTLSYSTSGTDITSSAITAESLTVGINDRQLGIDTAEFLVESLMKVANPLDR